MSAVLDRLPARSRARLRLVPWWVWVLAIWAATRILTTVILLQFAAAQGANPWTDAAPDYAAYAAIWDGRWYEIIAGYGYPSVLPVAADGVHVGENAWAFMPVYPFVVSAVQFATGFAWAPASVVVSVLASIGCALVFCRLARRFLSPSSALFAVLLLCTAPVSPLFQLGYAESLQLFLLAVSLLLLVERRYLWLFPVVLVMGFTRPTGLAFALAMVFHVVWRWTRRGSDPFPSSEVLLSSALAIWSGVVGLAWPGIAWIVTGSMTAYTDTELAWRSAYIGYQHLVPFAAWFQSGNWWFGEPLGALIVVAIILLFALVLWSRRVRIIGPDLMFWVAAYGLYLLAVFFPQSSTFRLMAPLFPLLIALAAPRSMWLRVPLVVVFVGLQIVWIAVCWGVDGSDWTPP